MRQLSILAATGLLATGLLSACGKGENAPGPGGVTVGEARALDEAAEMIEQRRLPESAIRPAGAHTASAQATAPPATPR